MKGYWVLMSGTVLVMLLLTPLVIRQRTPSWTTGWLAILLGSVVVMVLMGLAERLTGPEGKPTDTAGPES